MRSACVVLVLLLQGCTPGGSGHGDSVDSTQRGAIHDDLKQRQFPEQFGPVRAGSVGCAERPLGATKHKDRTTVYLRYECGGWLLRSCPARPDSGISAPALVELRGDSIERWQFPGDGADYGKDIDAWFPRALRDTAAFPGNKVVDELQRAARRDAGCCRTP